MIHQDAAARRRRFLLAAPPLLAALALALSVPSGLNTARGEDNKTAETSTICQGNDIYIVCVDDTSSIGRYTARTGPSHPVPGRNLLYGGESSSPGTSFNSYRSITSGTDYTQGSVSGGTDLSSFASTATIGTTGVRTTYNVTGQDDLLIVQDVNVNGTTFADSNVEVTTVVTNTGASPVQIAIRYLWDMQIGSDDGPTFRQRSPDGSVVTTEEEFTPPTFTYYEIQDNDFDDPTSPLYTVLGTATGPATVTPPPTPPPTHLTHACWPDSYSTAFDYAIVPGRDAATTASPCRGFAGGDTAVLYWWGQSGGDATTLGSGESMTVRALLFAVEPGGPPPFEFGLDHFRCYQGRTAVGTTPFQRLSVTLEDQFETKNTEVVAPMLFCNPVDKNGEGIGDPTAHLTCYAIRDELGQTRFTRRDVLIDNQFGEHTLTVLASSLLCVPSEKDGVQSALNLDHFKCYVSRVKPGTTFSWQYPVTLTDQFQTKETSVLLPLFVCNPVDKDAGGILDASSHLVCYLIKDRIAQRGSPADSFFPGRDVEVMNQFGQQTITAFEPSLLCVPSSKSVFGGGP